MLENATTESAAVFDLTLTLEDYNALQEEIFRTTKRSLSARQKYALGACWLLSVAFFVVLYQMQVLQGRDLAFMLVTLAATRAALQWMTGKTRARLAPSPDGPFLGAVRVELSEPRLRVTSRHFEMQINWSAVRQLRETPTHLFLMIDTAAGYILPKRFLGSEAAIWALRSLLSQRITMGRAAPDAQKAKSFRAASLALLLMLAACHGQNDAPTVDDARDGGAESDARGEDDASDTDGAVEADDAGITLPPTNAGLDYQLGGSYAPPANVGIVSRDRTEKPAEGLYNICYINGFQAQPDADDFWLMQHPDLVLRDAMNKPVIDKDWNEMLLDISSADKRARLFQVEADWIAGCARAGFQALEVDNLDTYSRSSGRISQDHAVAFMKLLSAEAHRQGLAIAQKNATDIVDRRAEMGTDFVVSEECAHYDECDDYIKGYGEHVLLIEYTKSDFDKACKGYPNYSVVLRDRDLVVKGHAGYVFNGC